MLYDRRPKWPPPAAMLYDKVAVFDPPPPLQACCMTRTRCLTTPPPWPPPAGMLYDKDAVYIDIPDWKVQYSARFGAAAVEEQAGVGAEARQVEPGGLQVSCSWGVT